MSHNGHFTAILDANVLYSAPLRDILIQLAGTGLFQARWSAKIEQEFVGALLRNRPDLDPAKLDRMCELMHIAVEDCLIEGYESLTDAMTMPAESDRHVVAAAIIGRADVIVTNNLKHFPAEHLPANIEAQSPDHFLRNLHDLSPYQLAEAVLAIRDRLVRNPRTIGEMLETYREQGLTETAAALVGNEFLW